MPRTPATQLIASMGLSLLAATAIMGCSDSTTPTGQAAPQSQIDAHANDPKPDLYTGIRGEITQMPNQSIPGSELKIHHEQVENFKTQDGKINVNSKGVKGMSSMTMPFPPADGLSLADLSVGDKIEFDFVVNWGSKTGPSWEVTRITKLPADTEIDFTNKVEEMPAGHQEMLDKLHEQGMDGMDGMNHGTDNGDDTGTKGP